MTDDDKAWFEGLERDRTPKKEDVNPHCGFR